METLYLLLVDLYDKQAFSDFIFDEICHMEEDHPDWVYLRERWSREDHMEERAVELRAQLLDGSDTDVPWQLTFNLIKNPSLLSNTLSAIAQEVCKRAGDPGQQLTILRRTLDSRSAYKAEAEVLHLIINLRGGIEA